MKVDLSNEGDLSVGFFILPLLSLAIGLAVLVGVVDVGMLWAFHHDGMRLQDVTVSDVVPFAAITLIAIAVLTAVLGFAPIHRRFVFSRDSILVFVRTAFKTKSSSYALSEIESFGFKYFLPYHSWFRSARIRMNFRNGEAAELMTLQYIAQCKRVHAGMESHFAGLGRGSMVGRLPAD